MKKFDLELTKREQKQLKGGFETMDYGENNFTGEDCARAPSCKDGCKSCAKTSTGTINPRPGDIGIGGGGII